MAKRAGEHRCGRCAGIIGKDEAQEARGTWPKSTSPMYFHLDTERCDRILGGLEPLPAEPRQRGASPNIDEPDPHEVLESDPVASDLFRGRA